MRKILYSLLFLLSVGVANGQVRVDSIVGIPQIGVDSVHEGQPYSGIQITLRNSGATITTASVLDIILESNLVHIPDTLTDSTGISFDSIPSGSITLPIPNTYIPTSAHFDDGDNIIVVWPAARTIALPIDTDTLSFHVYFVSTSSIFDPESKKTLTVYPNPATSYFMLGKADGILIKQVRITDILGREIYLNNSVNNLIPIGNWKAGMYFIEVENTAGDRQVIKLQKY